jgi:SAM-dependent methyltransferase
MILSANQARHLDTIRTHFEDAQPLSPAALSYRRILARYYNLLIPADASVIEIGCGSGTLLKLLHARTKAGVDLSPNQIQRARETVPDAELYVGEGERFEAPGRTFDYIILSDAISLAADVEQLFDSAQRLAHEKTRLLVNFHSILWRPAIWFGTAIGLRRRHPEPNWLTREDVTGLLRLSDWEPIRFEARILAPFDIFGLEKLVNRWIAPLLPWLCLVNFGIARPKRRGMGIPAHEVRGTGFQPVSMGRMPMPPGNMGKDAHATEPPTASVSIVIPARNESGNIAAAVERTLNLGTWTELIFVEGNSRDDTWQEILRVKAANPERRIQVLRQSGRGKGNAVREGFEAAGGDLLMILDADLTVPPEELSKFYRAVVEGKCEFANGSRLVYPMEQQAMRLLNLGANKAFSIIFSWLLGQHVKDTLCGTKVLWRSDYLKIVQNRSYFGEFDPFGDFDLLFGASKLNLQIVDVPIRYAERTYGETNIKRWRHGLLLLRMVLFAARKLKFV